MATKSNKVFIATSLDGFIAEADGGIAWLDVIPQINEVDSGYAAFTADIDALVMGRHSFETVCSFDIEWPYTKPVYVLSQSLKTLPDIYKDKVFLLKGSIPEIVQQIHEAGHFKLYVDGGKVIQSFLKVDLIDEMIITTIPVLLGQGIPLFGDLDNKLLFECKRSKIYCDAIVQNQFIRKRD